MIMRKQGLRVRRHDWACLGRAVRRRAGPSSAGVVLPIAEPWSP